MMPDSPEEKMVRIDTLLSHVWMVRRFLKNSEEAIDDGELCDVHRALYDFMLSLGKTWKAKDAVGYLKQAKKKIRKFNAAVDLFNEIQPEISTHTNFEMARRSLEVAAAEINEILGIE